MKQSNFKKTRTQKWPNRLFLLLDRVAERRKTPSLKDREWMAQGRETFHYFDPRSLIERDETSKSI